MRPLRSLAARLTRAAVALALLSCSAGSATAPDSSAVSVSVPRTGGLGGLSAIHVYPGGERFLALSDRTYFVEGRLLREGGVLTGVEIDGSRELIDYDGSRLGRFKGDSEGLAVAPDGRIWTSFEGVARVRIEDRGDGLPERLPPVPGAERMQGNASLEALAVAPDGSLWTLPERSGRYDRPFPVFRFDGTDWREALALPRRDSFLPTGADVGPDGRLYVLERDFTGLGFRTRIRRVDLDGSGEATLYQSTTGTHGNLEGISVWRDGAGRLRATMVSDNNDRIFLRSEIVEIVLGD